MKATAPKAKAPISIEDRLSFGNLSIDETIALKNVSKTQFYQDVKAGRVTIQKIGRKSVVPGPVAKAYIAGEAVGA